jgi:hypothetical protein
VTPNIITISERVITIENARQHLDGEDGPRLRAPGLEPCSNDRGQASYQGSEYNAQRADKRHDNGVRDLNAQTRALL